MMSRMGIEESGSLPDTYWIAGARKVGALKIYPNGTDVHSYLCMRLYN